MCYHVTVIFFSCLTDKRMNNVQGFKYKPDKCRWEIRLKSQAASTITTNYSLKQLLFHCKSLNQYQVLEVLRVFCSLLLTFFFFFFLFCFQRSPNLANLLGSKAGHRTFETQLQNYTQSQTSWFGKWLSFNIYKPTNPQAVYSCLWWSKPSKI